MSEPTPETDAWRVRVYETDNMAQLKLVPSYWGYTLERFNGHEWAVAAEGDLLSSEQQAFDSAFRVRDNTLRAERFKRETQYVYLVAEEGSTAKIPAEDTW